ncbi:hypothetical protein NL529_34925, partial [Klebsiella pneumoniae]|nr:hypothetical protein [Klebsiella pneumoniae]
RIEDFAHWVLAQSRFRPPEEGLMDLLAIVRKNSSQVVEVVPIWGVSPKCRIDLEPGVAVIPIEEIQPSRLKDLLMG